MIWLKNMRVLVAFAILVAVMSLVACGGGSDESSSSKPPQPAAGLAPTVGPEPTIAPKATAVAPIATAIPPTATPIPTPEPPIVLDEFGFSLGLDRGAYVNNLAGNTNAQGMVQLEYSGVIVMLSWVPTDGVANEGLVAGMFDMLQGSQADLTLETVSESSFNVGLESGLVIGFKSSDSTGGVAGGGLIGAWNCLDEVWHCLGEVWLRLSEVWKYLGEVWNGFGELWKYFT